MKLGEGGRGGGAAVVLLTCRSAISDSGMSACRGVDSDCVPM